MVDRCLIRQLANGDEFRQKGWVSMPVALPKERNVNGLIDEPFVEVKGFSVLGGEKS